jgi:hypothetical protein
VRIGHDQVGKRLDRFLGDSPALRVAVKAELHKDVETMTDGLRRGGERTDEGCPVEGVERFAGTTHQRCLIALQLPDEMPAQGATRLLGRSWPLIAAQFGKFAGQLLRAIFSDVTNAKRAQMNDVASRPGLGDGDDRELARIAASGLRSAVHPQQ